MNTVAASRSHLKKRIDDYLWFDQSPPLVNLRKILSEWFIPLGEIGIVGGFPRDFARKGVVGFKSDIDLAINADPAVIETLATKLGGVKNRFGGFSLLTPLWKIDFWALKNTWAHKEKHVRVRTINDLTKCTFFTMDAIIYNLSERKVFASERYLHDLMHHQIEINLLPNPSIDGNMVRGVRRTLAWDLVAGKTLRKFFASNMSQDMYKHIIETENQLYGQSFAAEYDGVDMLLEALFYKETRKLYTHSRRGQYELRL